MVPNYGKEKVITVTMGYCVTRVSEVMSMTHSSANSVNGGIPLKNVTGDTVDIS